LIAIVDYGVGNLRSVERALVHVGATPKLTADQDELQRADGLVLPGVGAFAPALEKLVASGLGISSFSRSRWSTGGTRDWACSTAEWSR